MKLVIVHESAAERYSIYEVTAQNVACPVTSFTTEQAARDYCEGRQKSRVIAEYEMTCPYG